NVPAGGPCPRLRRHRPLHVPHVRRRPRVGATPGPGRRRTGRPRQPDGRLPPPGGPASPACPTALGPVLPPPPLPLRPPTGEVVYQGTFADAGPFTLPQSGPYELTVSGGGSVSGPYALRVVDAGAAPVLPEPVVTGTLDSLRHTAVYRVRRPRG